MQPLVEALAGRRVPRGVAGQALLTIGWPALPQLRVLAESQDPAVRATAVELIGLIGDAGDGRLLAHRLHDGAAAVRASAAIGLGRLGAQEAAAALRATLEDRIPFVRSAAAEGLGALGDVESAPALTALAADPEFEPAQAAARALARMDAELVRRAAAGPYVGVHLREALDVAELATR